MTKTTSISPRSNSTDIKLVQVGNYRFTGKVLGKGSFAIVKEALHVPSGVLVSVKIIDLKQCNSYLLKNHLREANILQTINHPFILHLFETMKYNSMYYLVTEIVQGIDLCAFVQQHNGKVEETVTRLLSRQIASALQYLHQRGIVHRDLKLENVMLDSTKRKVKLIDFGLTNTWNPGSPLRTLCGSPEYCAPELFVQGTEYGAEVDMWAFGVIIFALAAGRLPFPCISTFIKIPAKRSEFLKQLNKGLLETQTKLINKNYSLGFIHLVKGLMNPNWEERLAINDVIRDPWITNREHWVGVPQESLDSHDKDKIIRLLSFKLNSTPEKIKVDIKVNPTGEVAGYFRILAYAEVLERHRPISGVKLVSSPIQFPQNRFPRKHSSKQKVEVHKLTLVGNAMALNEVSMVKKMAQKTLTPSGTTHKSSAKIPGSVTKEVNVVLPKINSFSSSYSTPLSTIKGKLSRENKLEQANTSSRKRLTIGKMVLPSKFDIGSPAKSFMNENESLSKALFKIGQVSKKVT